MQVGEEVEAPGAGEGGVRVGGGLRLCLCEVGGVTNMKRTV